MSYRTIRFCYNKIIDAKCPQNTWERHVWEDSYTEFLLQVQNYEDSKKYNLYSDLIQHTPNAGKLSFLVSTAVVGYLRQLNAIIPDIKSVLGKPVLPFRNYRFGIIESDSKNKMAHKIAILFISESLLWHDTIDGTLLISVEREKDTAEGAILTEMITMQPHLSIFSLQQEQV